MMFGDLDKYLQKMKLDHQRSPYAKISSRWKKDLNHDTIKVLEENVGRNISDIPHNNIFTDILPRAGDVKDRINKWDPKCKWIEFTIREADISILDQKNKTQPYAAFKRHI